MLDSNSDDLPRNWNFARDFPSIDQSAIERPYLLETIADILTPSNPVVFLEGEEGDGATTTLAQFCQKYPDQTFSLFIKPASRFAYSPDYLRLALAEQFYWYIYGISLDKPFIDESEFQTLIHQVRKKKKATTLYFVVDGLHQIPVEDARMVEIIVHEVLPIGVDNCRFIITGQQTNLGQYITKVGTKPYQQLKFRPEDTQQYLSKLNLSEEDISEIHKICKGVPGRIASVKRLISTGTNLKSILDSEPDKYLEFVKLEFNSLDTLTPDQQKIVAILTFSKHIVHTTEILQMTKASPSELGEILNACKFLITNRSDDVIEFISETHRRFAEKRLEKYEKESLSMQVEHLLRNPNSEIALRFLPTYYQQLNQQQAIVDLLSTDHFTRLLESTESISALRSRAELGARSAAVLRQTTGVFKFALQRSIFTAVGSQDAMESEVNALVALDQPQKALILANSAVSKEARLSLMVNYAKRVKEKRGAIDPELLNFIKELSNEIDFSELGDKAVEIAADIIFFDPDLAVTIIEQANKRNVDLRNQDEAFTHLSITASLSRLRDRSAIDDKVRQRISDTALQKFANSIALLVESLTADEIIKIVEQIDKAHRLYFAKSIVSLRRDKENILDVVEYALDLMIGETALTPKSRDLADLAIPLPYATQDMERLKKLITRFENQMGLVAKSAFSKDLTLLQMRLAHAELSFDLKKASNRIDQAYYEVALIVTPEVQTECFAIMLSILDEIDSNNELENTQGFRAVIKQDLTKVLDQILGNIADHTEGISGALSSLAKHDCVAALDLSSKLNTEDRRDEAYRKVIEIVSKQSFTDAREGALQTALGRITSKRIRSETVHKVIDIIGRNSDKARWVDKISSLISEIEIPDLACEFLIKEFLIRVELEQTPDVASFNSKLTKLIKKVDSKLEVIDLYFMAVEGLAKCDVSEANRYYELGRALKEGTNPNTSEALNIVELCISLIARSFRPLMSTSLLTNDMEQRFANLVDTIPCTFTRTSIYADLAARAWCAGRGDLCKNIINSKCRPLVEESQKISDYLFRKVIQVIFPVSCLSHPASAFPLLVNLSRDEADDVLYDAATMIIRRLPPIEPLADGSPVHIKLESNDAIDLLEILSHISGDSAYYWTLSLIVEAITSKVNTLSFTIQQKTDYAIKIQQIIPQKLPDRRNIQHVGYKVAAIAQTFRLVDHLHSEWQQLESDAKTITNIADQAYVLIELSKCMPPKFEVHRKRLLNEALALIDQIPSPIDRLSHYEGYIEAASKNAVISAKETLKRAITLSTELETTARVEKHRRQLIDIADRIEDGLADKLIELIDDDPARANAKKGLRESAALNKAKREIANTKAIKDIKKHDPHLMPNAVWKNVAALLAGRLETKQVDIMAEYVLASGADLLSSAYPILTWYIENDAKKFTRQRDVADQIVPICEALLLSTEMAIKVLAQASRKKAHISMPISLKQSESGPVVCSGSRDDALQYIANWLHSNAVEYIIYADPYFGPEDLPFLRMVLSECPECKVYIVASKLELKNKNALSADVFQNYWKKLADQDPPETEIIAVGSDDNDKGLFHDRWLLSKGCGIRIGASFNSIGIGKLSEISEMEPAKASACELQLDKFLERQRFINGTKVSYSSFTL